MCKFEWAIKTDYIIKTIYKIQYHTISNSLAKPLYMMITKRKSIKKLKFNKVFDKVEK